MTVSQLISKLQKYDGRLEVRIVTKGQPEEIFGIFLTKEVYDCTGPGDNMDVYEKEEFFVDLE